MAVRIRLKRRGRKKLAMYDIIVADARSPRDGKFIEKLGLYNPNTDPATIELNADKAFEWVMDGAQPSDTARSILSYKGVMIKKHLQVGVNKGAITQEEADKKYAEWMKTKEAKTEAKIDGIAQVKAAVNKSAFEAEVKVKEARAEMLLKKQSEMIAAEEAAAKKAEAEAAGENAEVAEGEEAPVAAAEATEAAPVEEAPIAEAKEEAPAVEAKEETPAVEAKEETPAKEVKEEAPAAEAKEEAPAVEAKEETPAEEVKEEAPAVEAKEETPAKEVKEEAPVAEKKEEEKKED